MYFHRFGGSSLLVVVGGAGIPRIVTQTRIQTALFFNAIILAVAAATLSVGAVFRDAAFTIGGTGVAAVAALVFGGTEVFAVVALCHGVFLLFIYVILGDGLSDERGVGAMNDDATAIGEVIPAVCQANLIPL